MAHPTLENGLREVSTLEAVEHTLWFIAQEGWRNLGQDFFAILVRHLAETLGCECAVVGKVEGDAPTQVDTVAFYLHGEILPNISYDLAGTPCENVIGNVLCCHRDAIQSRFPADEMLVDMGAESYIGIPLWSSRGRVIGLISVLGCKPLANCELAKQILQVVALRASSALERQRADAEKEKLQTQLLQSQKFEAMGKLAGGIAHDFNNMLGVILGQVEIALLETPESDPRYESLKAIEDTAVRSSDLTRQLLAFARQQRTAPRVLSLNDAVSGSLKMLLRLVGEGVDLRWSPGIDLWPVLVDPGQVDQVLTNLCINARDAMRGEGRIQIATANTSVTAVDGGQNGQPAIPPGEYVRLTVHDTGEGMDEELLADIFEPFFTTKEAGEGTGLGLATVYGIVKQNRGYIFVDSEKGEGTTFEVYLPRLLEDAGENAADAAANLEKASPGM